MTGRPARRATPRIPINAVFISIFGVGLISARNLITEQQRRELMQTAAPGLEFVSCVGRDIRGILDTDLFEGFVIGVYIAGVLAASATGEHDFDFLPETGRIVHVICCDNATAEETDVRELVEILQRDELRLRSTHGESSHAAMGLIRQGAEVGVYIRDQFANQNLLEVSGRSS